MRFLFHIVAWLLVAAIVGLSIVPPEYRVVTDFPRLLEHFSIFPLVGLVATRSVRPLILNLRRQLQVQ